MERDAVVKMPAHHLRAIENVLEKEGGFVDHPSDHGGPTNFGITIRTLIDYRGCPVSANDVKNLTRDEAIEIYHHRYIKGPNLDLLKPEWLFNMVFDSVVQWGARRGVLLIQKACCVIEDGILGPITARTANEMDQRALRDALLFQRVIYRARRVRDDRSQGDFIVGWIKRDFEVAGFAVG